MQFSSRLPIALHILSAIKIFEGQYKTTSTFLAGSLNVNPVIIRNTLGQLKTAGIVYIRAGEGGAEIIKDPNEITIFDIFCAVEKEETLFHYHENPNPQCPVGRNIHAVLDDELGQIEQQMQDKMKSITLADVFKDMESKIVDGKDL